MNTKVSDMVVALAQGKASVANDAFQSVMAEKVNAVLDERKVAVASQIYSQSKSQQ